MTQTTHDCSTCPYYRSLNNKKKGARIPGGIGKCIREEGICENPKPRPGIGGGGSDWCHKREKS